MIGTAGTDIATLATAAIDGYQDAAEQSREEVLQP